MVIWRVSLVAVVVGLLGACGPTNQVGVQPDGGVLPDGGVDPGERCRAGLDSDGDGLPNDVECATGTDPYAFDSDGDGISDGVERDYPEICVADDPAAQRRPVVVCTDDGDCQPGERCRGLLPTSADSDGDGVPDGEEDWNLDGVIDVEGGETDPRLPDTDGDGLGDDESGVAICRPEGLATVTQVPLAGFLTQLGHDPVWGTAVEVTGAGSRAGLLLDDPVAGVSGAVFVMPSSGDVHAEQLAVETAISAAVGGGITPVLVGRALVTHELQPAVTSTYRVARTTTASALRDDLVAPFVGIPAPGGAAVGTGIDFLLDVTTVARTSGTASGYTDVIVTLAPTADYGDVSRPTAIRSGDLVNTTGVAEAGKGLGFACQVFRAERRAMADFLWTVDTSSSMNDDQARLGNTATQFFAQLNAAGVDFRVGVVQAGSRILDIDSPGFAFIGGTDPTGATALCQQVTTGVCPTSPGDTLRPYNFTGSQEEPTAAAILAHDIFKRRGDLGETNLNRRFRPGAVVVTFHVTDEPGSNDFSRYFATSNDPETGLPWGSTYNAASLGNIVDYFHRNEILTFGLVPVRANPCAELQVTDLPRCVIEGNGGAVIPIATALQPEIDAAMARIVTAVAGATSEFALTRSPITSTIKVRVRGQEVPRSRQQGFDYDPAMRSIIFFGTDFRPQEGDEVVISYRVWEGSIG